MGGGDDEFMAATLPCASIANIKYKGVLYSSEIMFSGITLRFRVPKIRSLS